MATCNPLTVAAVIVTVVLYAPSGARARPRASDMDPRIEKLVASISEQRMQQLLHTLVGFGTRNTMSNQSSPARGIGAARQWIFDELTRTSPKLQVSFDTHILQPEGRITREVELRNVIAVLPGRSPRRIYVSGHYDSLNLGSGGQAGLDTDAGREGARPQGAGPVPPQPVVQGQPATQGQPAGARAGPPARRPEH